MIKTISIPKSLDMRVVLDLLERVLMVSLFIGMNWRILPHLEEQTGFINFFVLISEGATTFFILTHRKASNASFRVSDWILTVVATAGPTLVVPSLSAPIVPLEVCGALITLGFALQISAKMTLRRSFGVAPANRGVKIGGPYRLLRHPMYAGYLLTYLSFLGAHPSYWNFTVYALSITAQCFRLLAEERILGSDPTYQSFMQSTRYRLIPFLF